MGRAPLLLDKSLDIRIRYNNNWVQQNFQCYRDLGVKSDGFLAKLKLEIVLRSRVR